MPTYAILQHPGHNRVYYQSSGPLALAELSLTANRLETPASPPEIQEWGGIRYLSLETERPLSEADLTLLSRLSFVFGMFEAEGEEESLRLKPLIRKPFTYVDSKIGSLLKYPGKTHELFTRMMLNVALLSSDFSAQQKIQLLDPVSGRGTTLFEGLIYGFEGVGIEIEGKHVHEAAIFFRKYLEHERYKHNASRRPISGKNKSEAIYVDQFEFARNKQEFKAEDGRKILAFVHGYSQDAHKYFKKNRFHLIVGDLPYGIAHANSGTRRGSSYSRNPVELLESSLESWHTVLKPGGTLVLAWNAFLLSREKLADLFTQNGFQVLSDVPYDQFEHMVDKSIKRDVIVGKKA